MGADFSRVRFNPLLDFAGVELKQGGVAARRRRQRARRRSSTGACARWRATCSAARTVSSTTPDAFQITVAGRHAAASARAGSTSMACSPRTMARRPTDPAKRLFDAAAGRAAVRRSDRLRRAALSAQSAGAADGRPSPRLPRRLEPRGHASRAARPGRERGRRRDQLAPADRLAGARARPRMPARRHLRLARRRRRRAGRDSSRRRPAVLTTGTFEVAAGRRSLRAAADRRLPRAREPALPRRDPRSRPARRHGATFKWSRENASVGSRVASMISATELELETLGRDDVLRFNTGDWVEIIDDVREFSQRRGEMRTHHRRRGDAAHHVHAGAAGRRCCPAAFPNSDFPRARNLRVRRWDQKRRGASAPCRAARTSRCSRISTPGSTGVITVPAAGTTLLLENGVTVQLRLDRRQGLPRRRLLGVRRAHRRRVGGAARPRAAARHPSSLRAARHLGRGGRARSPTAATPGRRPASGHDCSCTACVTPESHASGQFTIQDAVNQRAARPAARSASAPGSTRCAQPVRLNGVRSRAHPRAGPGHGDHRRRAAPSCIAGQPRRGDREPGDPVARPRAGDQRRRRCWAWCCASS